MISPELLRHFPVFRSLSEAQLRSLAMIANQEDVPSGTVLFHEGQPADTLYLLKEGNIDLYYIAEKAAPDIQQGIPVGEINPGELFSISALIEPHTLSATARASKPSVVIRIEAKALQALLEKDRKLAYLLTYQAAKATIERLRITRIQLAAAWA